MNKTTDMKVTFLGINPVLKDETGSLNPQQIASLSALLTFKGKTVQGLKKDALDKGQDLNEKIKKIMIKASLRGHASIATTPVFSFSYEASKFLDSMLTGIVFSSSLMASGRRTDTDVENIIIPISIEKYKEAKKIYLETSKKIIKTLDELLASGLDKDKAGKLLQYGVYGTGIISFSVESLLSFRREYENEKEWMPEEAGIFLAHVEKELKNMGIDLLYTTRFNAPRNFYPYPNIFKNPKETNIVRELVASGKMKQESNVLSLDCIPSKGLKKRLEDLSKKYAGMYKSKENIRKNWLDVMIGMQSIARDYINVFSMKILSTISWRVWGEKKRHRTVPMVSESIYYCVSRATKIYKKHKNAILKNKLTLSQAKELDMAIAMPAVIRNNPEFLQKYARVSLEALECYEKLVKMGIAERDALFVVPRGVRVDVFQEYNLFNLLNGYFPLRLCATAEEQMRGLATLEASQIRKMLKAKKLQWMEKFLEPKCFSTGFCPEEKSCGMIKKAVKNYDDKFHVEMKEDLEKRFHKELNRIEK